FFFFSSRRRHTRFSRDWSSDVCSSDLALLAGAVSDPKTINVEGSPAYQADAKTLEELRNAGAQVVGASAEVLRTELVTVGPGARSEERRVGKGWGDRGVPTEQEGDHKT